jgi:hypothetical protein
MEERSPQELTASDSTPQLVRSFAASQKCRSHWQQPVLRNQNWETWKNGVKEGLNENVMTDRAKHISTSLTLHFTV